ncbi:DUF1642 domain-containing protein [Lactococcus lactis]|uniref:DUF1642 domain-containing protein n=1 Tax=Lactococcus lactis TaxID=1358 RepID=UPI0023A9DE03|nr:DUF1642 domain-containing protein [Lactococcus lactis]WEA54642.1 DUF1642 domain-containing protein [Lactococcus lactis]
MTKFEEDLNNKINLKEVPMHFTQSGCSLTRKTYIETNWVFDTYGNWHSDEEFQELKEEYSNQADSILLMLEEIGSLKSQLQQQALPVVPECVAKDVKRLSLSTLADWNVAVSYISKETLEWLSTTGNTNIFLGKSWTLCSLKINGFKVEKPQLFYLRDE